MAEDLPAIDGEHCVIAEPRVFAEGEPSALLALVRETELEHSDRTVCGDAGVHASEVPWRVDRSRRPDSERFRFHFWTHGKFESLGVDNTVRSSGAGDRRCI